MDIDYKSLALKTIIVHRIQVGPEWRTENFVPASRIIPWTRIYFPVEGAGAVKDGDDLYILKPGMMLLVPPFANVSVCCQKYLCKFWTHFNALLPETNTDIFFQYGKCIKIDTTGKQNYFTLLFERLVELEKQTEKSPIDYYEYDSHLHLLLAPFLRVLTETPEKSALPHAIELLQYIESNYNQKMSLEELAKVACMHPNYLCTCFHRRMNMTVFEYIDRVRLFHALEYIRLGKMTISEIAEKTGYSSLQAFSKNFRKAFGVSPRNYGVMEKNARKEHVSGLPKLITP